MMMKKMDHCLKGRYRSKRWLLCLMNLVNESMMFIAVYKSQVLCSIVNMTFNVPNVFLLVIWRWYCIKYCYYLCYIACLFLVSLSLSLSLSLTSGTKLFCSPWLKLSRSLATCMYIGMYFFFLVMKDESDRGPNPWSSLKNELGHSLRGGNPCKPT